MEEGDSVSSLAAKLRLILRRGLARQLDVEIATGVDQTVVSRVVNGRRKRMTPALQRLNEYADMLLSSQEMPPRVHQAAKAFLAFGSESDLVASIELAQRLVTHRRS